MIELDEKRKVGRPKKQKPFKLDESMDVETAVAQKTIATAKDAMYKAMLQEIKVKEALKHLVDFRQIVDVTTQVFSTMKSIMYSSSSTLPPQIVGKSPEETSKIVYDWIDGVLERFQKEYLQKINSVKVTEDFIEDLGEDSSE